MSETPTWPTVPYATVRWRLATLHADTADAGENPDWRAKAGVRLTLVPSVTGLVTYSPEVGDPITFELAEVPCQINSTGYLVTSAGDPVRLAVSDDVRMSVQGWTWFVKEYPTIRFSANAYGTVELSDFVIAPAVDQTKFWVDRIPELVDLLGGGLQIENIELHGTDLVFTMLDETTRTFTLPAASWEAIANKPTSFPAALPLPQGVIVRADNESSVSYNGFEFEVSGPDYPGTRSLIRADGTIVVEDQGSVDATTQYKPGVIYTGPSGSEFEAQYRLHLPVDFMGDQTLATQEWIARNSSSLAENVVRSVGRADDYATIDGRSDYGYLEWLAAPLGTRFVSTDVYDGVREWVKTENAWVVVDGETPWLSLDQDNGTSGTYDRFLVKRINDEVHFSVYGMAGSSSQIDLDVMYFSTAFWPMPFRVDLLCMGAATKEDGAVGGYCSTLPSQYNPHIRVHIDTYVSNAFGYATVKVHPNAAAWPTTSELNLMRPKDLTSFPLYGQN